MDAHNIAHDTSRPQLLGDHLGERIRSAPNGKAAEHEAIAFLKWLDPSGRHNLVALDPDGRQPPQGRTFEPAGWSEMSDWIAARERRLNLYYSVNEPRPGAPDKKLRDTDIAAVRCIYADLDPAADKPLDAERERLKRLAATQGGRPALVDSGGGYQLVWRLAEKLDPAEHAVAARSQGRGIAKALGGDAVFDLARVMRLPGTTNLPDAKKRARGRRAAMATCISVGASCALPELAALYPPAAMAEQLDADDEIAAVQAALDMNAIRGTSSLSDLADAVRGRFERLLESDERTRRLWSGDASVLGEDKTSSAWRAALAVCLARTGEFDAQVFGEILFCWDFAVADGRDHAEALTARVIARDWVRCGMPVSPLRWFGPTVEMSSSIWDAARAVPSAETPAEWTLISAQDAARNALKIVGRPLVEGLLDQETLSVLFGESNVGKTFVAMDIAFHVAAGVPWSGMQTTKTGVLYVAAEGGPGVGKRCAAARIKFGDAFEAAHFQLRVDGVDLLRPNADLRPLIEAALASSEKIGLVVVDTLSRALAGGDENSSIDMGALVKNVDLIRNRVGAHVMLVHHAGKDLAKGARGHSLLRAASDTEIEISEGQIVVRKQRDLDRSFQSAFLLERVDLGQDEAGRPSSSCVVRLADFGEHAREEPTPAEAAVLEAMAEIVSSREASQRNTDVKSIVEFFTAEGETRTGGTVRMQLKRLREKGLVRKTGNTKWALIAACCASPETLFAEIPPDLSAQQVRKQAQHNVFE